MSAEDTAAFLDAVDTEKYNAVVVPLKDSDGIIYYATGVSLAYSCGAVSSQQVDLESLITAIRSRGLKPVASIYTLHDHTAAHTRYGTSYFWMNDGFNYLAGCQGHQRRSAMDEPILQRNG